MASSNRGDPDLSDSPQPSPPDSPIAGPSSVKPTRKRVAPDHKPKGCPAKASKAAQKAKSQWQKALNKEFEKAQRLVARQDTDFLSPECLSSLQELVTEVKGCRQMPLLCLSQFLGKMVSCFRIVPWTRLHSQSLQMFLLPQQKANRSCSSHQVRVSPEVIHGVVAVPSPFQGIPVQGTRPLNIYYRCQPSRLGGTSSISHDTGQMVPGGTHAQHELAGTVCGPSHPHTVPGLSAQRPCSRPHGQHNNEGAYQPPGEDLIPVPHGEGKSGHLGGRTSSIPPSRAHPGGGQHPGGLAQPLPDGPHRMEYSQRCFWN